MKVVWCVEVHNIGILYTKQGTSASEKDTLDTLWSIGYQKFDANRCQILRLKCTQFDFRMVLRPRPRWRSLQLTLRYSGKRCFFIKKTFRGNNIDGFLS